MGALWIGPLHSKPLIDTKGYSYNVVESPNDGHSNARLEAPMMMRDPIEGCQVPFPDFASWLGIDDGGKSICKLHLRDRNVTPRTRASRPQAGSAED